MIDDHLTYLSAIRSLFLIEGIMWTLAYEGIMRTLAYGMGIAIADIQSYERPMWT